MKELQLLSSKFNPNAASQELVDFAAEAAADAFGRSYCPPDVSGFRDRAPDDPVRLAALRRSSRGKQRRLPLRRFAR